MTSAAVKCSTLSHRTALSLRKPGPSEDLAETLETWKANLDGTSAELDDVWIAASSLRRAIIPAFSKDSWTDENVTMCGIMFQMARVLPRYLGDPDLHQDYRVKERFKKRLQITEQSARPLMKSVLHLAKLKAVHNAFSWESLDNVLQDCALLGRYLDSAQQDPLTSPNAQAKLLSHVEVSNAYWMYYLFLRQGAGSSEIWRKTLQRCVEIVATRPPCERKQSFLSAKLEQLAISFERNGERQRATAAYKDAVKNHVECGMLPDSSNLLSSSSLWQLMVSTDIPAYLVRCLKAHARVASMLPECATDGELNLDFEDLDPVGRGFLLEVQLQSLVDCSSSPNHQRHRQSTIKRVSATLLAIYEATQYPLRRLRVICEILRVHISEPAIFEASFLQSLRNTMTGSFAHDNGLRRFAKQYKARSTILFALVDSRIERDDLCAVVSAWQQQLNNEKGIEDPPLHEVDGIERCIKELELAADYFEMKALAQERLAVLSLLLAICETRSKTEPATYVSKASELGTHYLRLGLPRKASSVIRKAYRVFEKQRVSKEASLYLFMAYAELSIEVGNIDKSQHYLSKAMVALQAFSKEDASNGTTRHHKYRLCRLASEYLNIFSLSTFRFGNVTDALYLQRLCVNLTFTLWATSKKQAAVETQGVDGGMPSRDEKQHSPSSSARGSPGERAVSSSHAKIGSSASLWPLVPRLVTRLLRLSILVSHAGLFLEAQYYLDEAFRICEAVDAKNLLLSAQIVRADLELITGNTDRGILLLNQIQQPVHAMASVVLSAEHSIAMATAHAMKRQYIPEYNMLKAALDLIEQYGPQDDLDERQTNEKALSAITAKIGGLSLGNDNVQKPKRTFKGKGPVSRNAKGTGNQLKKPNADLQNEEQTSTNSLSRSSARIKRLLASNLARRDMTEEASRILEVTSKHTTVPSDAVLQANGLAETLIRQVLLNFSTNPVYSLLKDSTTSYPSVARTCVQGLEKVNRSMEKPKGAQPAKSSRVRSKRQETPAKNVPEASVTQEHLARCFESLTSTLKASQDSASVALLHKMADLLYKDAMMLSVARAGEGTAAVSATFVAYALEMARSLATLRELATIKTESLLPHEKEDVAALDYDAALAELPSPSISPAQFQAEYINILPMTWCAISISLSDDREELRLSTLRAGQPPFMLSIPLNRDISQDPTEGSFGLNECMSELSAFIDLANFSTHDASNKSGTVSKKEWWAARSALDSRLRDLVHNVENIWLGGFRGLFAQNSPPRELLSRFQRSFYSILDKHLPSRRKIGKGRGQRKDPIVFDPRILEIFVGLGHPRETEEIENSLTDLLYFVVDILQFHGERNAYDEIDFDAITIEVMDALTCYHEAMRNDSQTVRNGHMILILDKALHSFPWEAMPCLAGQAVSRLPSLVSLRSRILLQQQQQQQQENSPASTPEGLAIDVSDGAYILNPAGDLVHTESTLGPPLANLPSAWSSVVHRAPTESEITDALATKSLYLYFGHGSGAQYVRTRRIRRLDRCAVALLMGCSSGTVTTAGSLESYGTPLNYLCGGAPAVVGTLWDVTDRDIDRFSVRCLEKWGLLEEKGKGEKGGSKSPVKKGIARGRGKGKAEVEEKQENGSSIRGVGLDRAVADARDACILKFLNGAAPVVYGIPVYLGPVA